MITFSQNCLHLKEQCMKNNWKAKSYAYDFGIGRIMYAVYGILLVIFLNHCVRRREAWISWKEHCRDLPRQRERAWCTMRNRENWLDTAPHKLMLAFLSFKVRPDNFQSSLPTHIFLWLEFIFMGMWTMLFHLVHLWFTSLLKSLLISDKSGAVRQVPVSAPGKKRNLKPTKKDSLQIWSAGHKTEVSLLLFLSGCFTKMQSFMCMFFCPENRNYATFLVATEKG